MAISTLLISVQHVTARLLRNQKNQPFVSFLLNLKPAQGLQRYKVEAGGAQGRRHGGRPPPNDYLTIFPNRLEPQSFFQGVDVRCFFVFYFISSYLIAA